jgi:hypothetical protein
LGGEEDLPLRQLAAVNPPASVMELYIVGVSVATDATNPSMAKILCASFSSNRATSKSVSNKKPVTPAARLPVVAVNMREMFLLCRRANFDSKFLP